MLPDRRAAQLEKLEGKIEHLVNALSKSQAQRGFGSVDYGQPSPPVSSISERSDKSQRPSRHELLHAMCKSSARSRWHRSVPHDDDTILRRHWTLSAGDVTDADIVSQVTMRATKY